MMTPDDSSYQTDVATTVDTSLPQQPPVDTNPPADVAPPVGVTPPQVLAQDAAAGRRGAAWRLLYWIMENDPRAVVAVSSLEDDRLAQHLLEFIAMGTWAGKPFVVPRPLRSAYARTRLRTLFLPESGMDPTRAERVLVSGLSDKRPVIRETAAHVLGIIGSPTTTRELIEALNDSAPGVRLQAVKALGRVKDASAVPALLNTLRNADEQLGSQIFVALVQLGHEATPALIDASKSSSTWTRWHCLRALGEIGDRRALPVLVDALRDNDHSVAWMGAKGLVHFGKQSLIPVLRLLMSTEATPWLVETASYVLQNQSRTNPKLKQYLEPVVKQMHAAAYQVATPQSAQNALTQLIEDGIVKA